MAKQNLLFKKKLFFFLIFFSLLLQSCNSLKDYAKYCGAHEPGIYTTYIGKITPDSLELYNTVVYNEHGCLVLDYTLTLENDTNKSSDTGTFRYYIHKDTVFRQSSKNPVQKSSKQK